MAQMKEYWWSVLQLHPSGGAAIPYRNERAVQAQGRFGIVGQRIANGNNAAGIGTGAVSADGINTVGNSGGNSAAAGNTIYP